jgi:polysaccharide export outer membrane protein
MNELGRRHAPQRAGLARNFLRGVAILLALGGAPGCGGPISPPPPDPDPMSRSEYIIGPSDVLTIRVWKNPELSVEQVPVRVDGKISTPLVNDVQAAGLTPSQLREVISQKLAEYVTAPDVTVIVALMNSRKVSVLGEVVRPGPVAISADTRVADAISAAGGFTQFANTRKVKILRRQPGGGVSEYRFNYGKWAGGGAPESNFLLQVDDTIVVPD